MGKWKNRLLAVWGAAALLGGCAPAITTREPVGFREVSTPLPISQSELESRAARLAKRLEQTKMGEKEKQVAMDLLNSYQIIGATLQPPMTDGDRQRVIRLLFESLSRLDEQYFQKEEQPPPGKPFEQYASIRREILRDYRASDYENVVNKCTGLRAAFGEEAVTPDIGLLFSISLSKLGRLGEAVAAGEKVIRELDRNPDRVNLRAYILEWQLAMGQERSAQDSLKDLIQRVAEKESLLRYAQKKAGVEAKEETPTPAPAGEVAPAPAVEMPDEQAPTADSVSLEKSLAEAKALISQKEYTKAKFILLQQRIRFAEGPETDAIDRMMQAIEAAEETKPGEEPPAPSSPSDTERVNAAKKLIEEEKYDEALAKLDAIQQEGGSSTELIALKDVATEKLINRERNSAAKLFLMARSETNPAKKEELLGSSLNILRTLLDKYPNTTLRKKINENMATIRDEMSRLKKKPE